MTQERVKTVRFTTGLSTETQYHIVDGWDTAFRKWFQASRKEDCWNRIAILSDETVWELYGENVRQVFRSLDRPIVPLVVAPGECSKDFRGLSGLAETLFKEGLQRRDLLMCLGGGMCCDLGGLLAMLYMRGIDYVNVPTSLMAQLDAAIGGKVGSNFGILKNVLGGFHHPLQVFIDPIFLDTLPDIYFRSAMAEALKVAIIREDTTLLTLLEEKSDLLLERRKMQLQQLYELCLTGKLEILKDDPYEACLDRSLNLGHAVAHALERLPVEEWKRTLLHGEAVAIGLAATTRYAYQFSICAEEKALRLINILRVLELPDRAIGINRELVRAQLQFIIHQRGGVMRLVVPSDNNGVTILAHADLDVLLDCLEPIPGQQM